MAEIGTWGVPMCPFFALAVASALAGSQTAESLPQVAQDVPSIAESAVRKLRANWDRWLEQAFSVTRRQTSDKSAAAELAFQSCATEEQLLARFVIGRGATPQMFLAIKARTK